MEQGSDEWFKARLGKITASKAEDWMFQKGKVTEGGKTYLLKRLAEIKSGQPEYVKVTEDMLAGTENEPKARFFYTKESKNIVEEVGFITHPELDYFGGSVDGRVMVDDVRGHIEIKCPALRNYHIHLNNCMIDSPEAFRKINPLAYWQATANFSVDHEAQFCDFISFYPYLEDKSGLFIYRLMRRDSEVDKVIPCVKALRVEMIAMAKRLNIELPTPEVLTT